MSMTAMVMIAAVGASAWAGETGAAQVRSVTVCIDSGREVQVAHAAQSIASKVFAAVGVAIEWRANHYCTSSPDVIRISLSDRTRETLLPGTLAYALPYEGTHIVVFCDRVLRIRSACPGDLLAYVLVHEITHMLQGINRHSAAGIMKASWGYQEYFEMGRRTLGFSAEDVDLIHRDLDE